MIVSLTLTTIIHKMFKQVIPTQEKKTDDTPQYNILINKHPLNLIPKNLRECTNCNNMGKGYLKCAKCKHAHFCSDKCYKENYKAHKHVCGLISSKRGLAYDKQISLMVAINNKCASDDFRQSGIYTSGKKYWRMVVDDWNDTYLKLVSIEKEEVDEYFVLSKYEEQTDKIFIYNEIGEEKGIKMNWIDRYKLFE